MQSFVDVPGVPAYVRTPHHRATTLLDFDHRSVLSHYGVRGLHRLLADSVAPGETAPKINTIAVWKHRGLIPCIWWPAILYDQLSDDVPAVNLFTQTIPVPDTDTDTDTTP